MSLLVPARSAFIGIGFVNLFKDGSFTVLVLEISCACNCFCYHIGKPKF